MTKRPEENDIPDMEAGMTTAERRRRRRRGGGLRVPSDNVPRRSGGHPVVAPPPEDPNVSASVAYNLGSDGSGPQPREITLEADAPDEAPMTFEDEATVSSSLEELGVSGDAAGTAGNGAAFESDAMLEPDAVGPSIDIDFDSKTRENPILHLDGVGVASPATPVVASPASAAPVTAAAAAPVRESRRTSGSSPRAATVALSDDDLEELIDVDGEGGRFRAFDPRRMSTPVAQVPVATTPIATGPVATTPVAPAPALAVGRAVTDAGIPAERSGPSRRAATAPPVPPERPERVDRADRSDRIERVAAPFSTPAVVTPARRSTDAPAARSSVEPGGFPRLGTEPGVGPRPAEGRVASEPGGASRRLGTEPGTPRHISDPVSAPMRTETAALVSRASAPTLPPPVRETTPWAGKPGPASGAEPSGETVAIVELGDEDLEGEVVQSTDAADSGEILPDELIVEVEGQAGQRARQRAAKPSVEAPAAVPTAEAVVAAAPVPAVQAAAATPAPASAVPAAASVHVPPAPPAGPVPRPPPAPKKTSVVRAAAVVAASLPDAQTRRKKRGKPWFEEIFDEDYLRTLPFLTPQATQAEAQFVIDSLGLQPGAQVLDLGCGYGRHAMELAARGYHVVGLDLSLPLLLRGADEAQRRGLSINFVHGDMRELDFDSQFDGAYCLFSTFGYFDDEANKKTASNLGRALKPGAKAVIEILNRDYLIADLPTRVWWEGDGCVVLEEVEYNYFSSRMVSNRSVVFDDGRQLEQEISLRAYSLHELGKLLHAAGFRVLEVSGSMVTRGRFFGHQSRHIIVVAERRAKDSSEITKA